MTSISRFIKSNKLFTPSINYKKYSTIPRYLHTEIPSTDTTLLGYDSQSKFQKELEYHNLCKSVKNIVVFNNLHQPKRREAGDSYRDIIQNRYLNDFDVEFVLLCTATRVIVQFSNEEDALAAYNLKNLPRAPSRKLPAKFAQVTQQSLGKTVILRNLPNDITGRTIYQNMRAQNLHDIKIVDSVKFDVGNGETNKLRQAYVTFKTYDDALEFFKEKSKNIGDPEKSFFLVPKIMIEMVGRKERFENDLEEDFTGNKFLKD